MSEDAAPQADRTPLCACGRPLRHPGRCIGFRPIPKPSTGSQPARDARLRLIVEQEIKSCHAAVAKLKAGIRTQQAELLEIEARLGPLVKLLAVYKELALPAPAQPQPPAHASTAAEPSQKRVGFTLAAPPAAPATLLKNDRIAPPVASVTRAGESETDYAPLEADFTVINAWAAARGIAFRSWEDLRAVNEKREAFELPTFKRKLGRT